jgi:transposase
LKNEREKLDVIAAYQQVGSYRGAAQMCGTTHKTVKRIVTAALVDDSRPARRVRERNYDSVAELVRDKVAKCDGRVSAKRLLPVALAAGYAGSPRNFRRLVAVEKRRWRQTHHRGRRPGVWAPGETLIIDWGVQNGRHVFCAVLAWSRWRFVRFARDEKATTTLGMLADCFEVLGGVPKTVLADRMGCLKGGVVANVVVPTADYVRFATHYGFKPDFCEANDPESKGMVENLVGYAKRDLLVPLELLADASDLDTANAAAASWCEEVNSVEHSQICAVPAQRLDRERELLGSLPSLRPRLDRATFRKVDKLSCVRIGSARYSVPNRLIGAQVEVLAADGKVRVVEPVTGELVAEHVLAAPGETRVDDAHYDRPRPDRPARAPRARTQTEKDFLALGPVAQTFLTGAAAAGVNKLATEIADILTLDRSHGRDALLAALTRAVEFGRWRAADIRSILAAGTGVPIPQPAGQALVLTLPNVPTRSLADYAIERPS